MAPEIAAEAPIIGTIAPTWVMRCANAPAAATKPGAEAPLRTEEPHGDAAEPMTDHSVLVGVVR